MTKMEYGSEEYLEFRCEEVKEHYEDAMNKAEQTKDQRIVRLVAFAIIDSMAQEFYNYPASNASKTFEDFILEFSNAQYLKEYDPVTLYYDAKENNLMLKNNLNYLQDGFQYYIGQINELDGSKKIINEMKQIIENEKNKNYNINNSRSKAEKILYRHTYIQLIYKYRSKIMHEYHTPVISPKSIENEEKISYISCGIGKNQVWELYIPYAFIKKLAEECMENFLKYCKNEKRDPFANSRRYDSWYE